MAAHFVTHPPPGRGTRKGMWRLNALELAWSGRRGAAFSVPSVGENKNRATEGSEGTEEGHNGIQKAMGRGGGDTIPRRHGQEGGAVEAGRG